MITADSLLHWYDQNAREMPWRIQPADSIAGKRPDSYHIWLSEVMLQQTTVAAVGRYFLAFKSRWPDVHALANAQDADVMGEWAGLGYYARARNLLKCARVISDSGGVFPNNYNELIALPGVGPYTAAAIAAIAFDQPATVVDANVERVIARIFAVTEPLPDCKNHLRELAESLTPISRAGDYAQAIMDLGATLCGRTPQCEVCPWVVDCKGRAAGIAAELPKKRPKPEKPTRIGTAYFVRRNDGTVLLETRPNKGLLGGMLALPSTQWSVTAPESAAPISTNWQVLPNPVRHTFTHFHLLLTIHIATADQGQNPDRGVFVPTTSFLPSTLPTVMRKAYRLGIDAFNGLNTND